MINEKDEIFMLENEIEKLEKELLDINPRSPENRFKYANKKSELNCLYKKLNLLTNNQNAEVETMNDSNQFNTTNFKKITKVIKPFRINKVHK